MNHEQFRAKRRDRLTHGARVLMADNDAANEKIQQVDALIKQAERNLADLRTERFKLVTIANYSFDRAYEMEKAR